MAKAKGAVKVGDTVKVVLADRKSKVDAKVIRVGDDDLLDVKFMHLGKPVTITSSPNDPAGKTSDSWHVEDETSEATDSTPASTPKA